jgi:hypothetical protein
MTSEPGRSSGCAAIIITTIIITALLGWGKQNTIMSCVLQIFSGREAGGVGGMGSMEWILLRRSAD